MYKNSTEVLMYLSMFMPLKWFIFCKLLVLFLRFFGFVTFVFSHLKAAYRFK